ncbi:MAG: hypothetical protein ACTSUE_07175 [Promethearchaeota archaeon]
MPDQQAGDHATIISDDEIKTLCEKLELKATKKYRILVRRLIKTVGKDISQLRIALKKAMLGK